MKIIINKQQWEKIGKYAGWENKQQGFIPDYYQPSPPHTMGTYGDYGSSPDGELRFIQEQVVPLLDKDEEKALHFFRSIPFQKNATKKEMLDYIKFVTREIFI